MVVQGLYNKMCELVCGIRMSLDDNTKHEEYDEINYANLH